MIRFTPLHRRSGLRPATRRFAAAVALAVTLSSSAGLFLAPVVRAWDVNTFSSGSESQLITLQNQARASGGLKALKLDTALRTIARWRSKDMARAGLLLAHDPELGNRPQRVLVHAARVRLLLQGRGREHRPGNLARRIRGGRDRVRLRPVHGLVRPPCQHHGRSRGTSWPLGPTGPPATTTCGRCCSPTSAQRRRPRRRRSRRPSRRRSRRPSRPRSRRPTRRPTRADADADPQAHGEADAQAHAQAHREAGPPPSPRPSRRRNPNRNPPRDRPRSPPGRRQRQPRLPNPPTPSPSPSPTLGPTPRPRPTPSASPVAVTPTADPAGPAAWNGGNLPAGGLRVTDAPRGAGARGLHPRCGHGPVLRGVRGGQGRRRRLAGSHGHPGPSSP